MNLLVWLLFVDFKAIATHYLIICHTWILG